jgi:hypothetical protein
MYTKKPLTKVGGFFVIINFQTSLEYDLYSLKSSFFLNKMDSYFK